MAAKKTKRSGASKSGGSRKGSKKSPKVAAKSVLKQAKKAIGKVVVAAAKGAAVGALQGAVEEGSNLKGVQQLKRASKKTPKGAAKKTSRKK
jgi:hypothetical protein